MKRFLVLFDTFMIDIFSVQGKENKQIDWIIHCRGNFTADRDRKNIEPLGNQNGYQHLKNVQKLENISSCEVYQFAQEDGKILRLFLPEEKNTEVFTGTGIGYHLKDSVGFLLRRRFSSNSCIITVYDFALEDKGRIKKVETIPLFSNKKKQLSPLDATGLKITTGEKIYTICLDMREKAEGFLLQGKQKLQRFTVDIKDVK